MLKIKNLGPAIAGVAIAGVAVVADTWHNARYVVRNATPEELVSILLTLVLSLGGWTRAWQFFAHGPGQSVMFPSSVAEVVIWSVIAPAWARLVWRSTAKATYDRREAAHVAEQLDGLEGQHEELLRVHSTCPENTGRHRLVLEPVHI